MPVELLMTAVESGFTCAGDAAGANNSASARAGAGRNGRRRRIDMSCARESIRPASPMLRVGRRAGGARAGTRPSAGWTKRRVGAGGAPVREKMTAERIPLDRLGWVRQTIAAFAASDVGKHAVRLSVSLVVLMLGISAMNVANSYVGRDFMTSIEQRDRSQFVLTALVYVGVFTISTVLAVLFRFCEERLGLLWRQWLTRALVLDYLGIATPYRLREAGEIDNPDQRIADDVRTFTTTTLSFVLMVLNGSITIIAFSGVLWSITPVLFAAAVGYAAVGAVVTMWLGRPLIGLSSTQSDREASFRADLVHVRANAESVALLRREGRLRTRLLRRVDALTANARRMIAVNRNVSFFT